MGGFTIKRRAKPQLLTCSSNATAQVKDSSGTTGSCLVIGTPVLSFNSSMSGLYDIPFSMVFLLNECMGYSEMTTIAEKFKITNVQVKVNGYNSQSVLGSLTYAGVPYIEFVPDYDDDTILSISSFEEKMGIRSKGFDQRGMMSINVRPKPVIYSTEGYNILPAKTQWVDTNTPQQKHFGLKGIVRNVNLYDSKSCGYRFTMTYTVALKDLA